MGVRKINVELVGAIGLKNSEYLGKSDPYVILSIGTTEFRSKVAEDQATAPVWNEKFVIPALESDTELLIRILNDNTMATDDELGRVVIPLAQYRQGESASTFTLQCKGKPQGELKMNLAFESEGDHESKRLIEKIQDIFVGETVAVHIEEQHGDDESGKDKIDELKEEAEEKREEKAEEAEEKQFDVEEEVEERIEEAQDKADEKKKKNKKHKHHKKSDNEGSSSSSDSESDEDEQSAV